MGFDIGNFSEWRCNLKDKHSLFWRKSIQCNIIVLFGSCI